eukprot:3105276-Amphidinium_carterae.1
MECGCLRTCVYCFDDVANGGIFGILIVTCTDHCVCFRHEVLDILLHGTGGNCDACDSVREVCQAQCLTLMIQDMGDGVSDSVNDPLSDCGIESGWTCIKCRSQGVVLCQMFILRPGLRYGRGLSVICHVDSVLRKDFGECVKWIHRCDGHVVNIVCGTYVSGECMWVLVRGVHDVCVKKYGHVASEIRLHGWNGSTFCGLPGFSVAVCFDWCSGRSRFHQFCCICGDRGRVLRLCVSGEACHFRVWTQVIYGQSLKPNSA